MNLLKLALQKPLITPLTMRLFFFAQTKRGERTKDLETRNSADQGPQESISYCQK